MDIQDGLSTVKGQKYLKLIEDDLGRIEIGPQQLKSIERMCIMCKTTLDITIQANALPRLASLHVLCQDLNVIPGAPGIEITHMKELKEIALHPDVDVGIKDVWQKAVDGHTNRPVPVLLSIEGP